MKKLFFLIIALMLNSAFVFSQETTKNVENIFAGKKEIYFKFSISSKQEIEAITKIISIDNVTKDNVVFAYANKKEFAKFLAYDYQYTLLVHPGELNKNPEMFDVTQSKQIQSWNAYPTYSAYEAMMYQFATDHPTICQIYNIGTLASGRKLLYAKISKNITTHENEPRFLFVSTIHGNETSGFIHMLHLIDTLLTSYGTNPRLTAILDNTELWINPLANPDGTYDASNGNSIAGATRGNINGVDMNRNFPDPVGGQHPDGEAWQPETQYFMGFADTMNFVMSANFHEGAEVCNYPWDCKSALTADDNWWKLVSNQFADTAQTYGPSGFFTDVDPTGITDGYAWYQVLGGRQDYMNYYQHCREETIEVSGAQSPSGSSLPQLWKGCKRSLLTYIEQSLKGIRGVVSDSCTGQGIRAFVSITGHDHDSSQIYSALPVGNYHRLIYTGTYNLTFSATGYQSRTINNISISNGSMVIKNIALIPLSPVVPVAGFSYASTGLTYNFTNTSIDGNTYSWDFGDGAFSPLQSPSHTYSADGIYNVQLIVSNNCGSDTISEQVTVSTGGVDPINENEQLSIFPNPTSGQCTIILSSVANEKINAEVYDLIGNTILLKSIEINKGENQFMLDMTDLSQGIYYIRIKSSQGTMIISKVVKL